MTDLSIRFPLRLSGLAWMAASAAFLVACASPATTGHRPLPMQDTATLGLDSAPTPATDSWWATLGDGPLDALVLLALKDQPSLAASRARLAQALALAGQSESTLSPQGGLSAEVTRQRFTERGLIPRPIAGSTSNSGTVQLGLAWSPDFFGTHAADFARAVGQARAAQADTAAAANLLSTQVARAYVGLARLLAQRELAERNLQQRQALLVLVRDRVAAGLDTRVEQTQAEGAVPDMQTQIEALDEQIVLGRRQLAVLAGQPPQHLSTLAPQLDQLQLSAVPDTLGLDLLGRRPEVLASRWRVEAASQGVNAARSEFYPNINLTAFAGLNALGLDRLLSTQAGQYGVSPAIRLPLFDGGRLRSQLRGREAELDAAIAQYNRALLDAVKEAGDALASRQSLARQQDLQAQALGSAETARRLSEERFRAGIGNFLLVLSTETQVLAQQRLSVDLRARQLDAHLALMGALGGGWEPSPPAPLASR